MKKSISIPVLTVLCTIVLTACTSIPTSSNTLIVPNTDNSYLMPKGMWKDPDTGLIWDRCNAGQTWNGTTCVGTAIKVERSDIRDYVRDFTRTGGHKDWRIPFIGELASLRLCTAGWAKEAKEISELTAQGRVTQEVNTIKTTYIPEDRIYKNYKGVRDSNGQIYIPRRCADGSSKPTLNTNIFPNTPTEGYYFSFPGDSTFSSTKWNLNLDNGDIGFRNTDFGVPTKGYVRAVRDSE